MMPADYGGVNVRHIGGESLLNLPKDEAVWFEMTQRISKILKRLSL